MNRAQQLLRILRTFSKHFTEGDKVFAVGGEDFVTFLLAHFICSACEVAHHGSVAFCIRQLIGIQVADGADDGFGQFVVAQRRGIEILSRSQRHYHSFRSWRRYSGRDRRGRINTPELLVKRTECAVRAAQHADLFPEIGHAQIACDHFGGTVELIAKVIQVGGFAHIIDLRRDGQAFLLNCGLQVQRLKLDVFFRQCKNEILEMWLERFPVRASSVTLQISDLLLINSIAHGLPASSKPISIFYQYPLRVRAGQTDSQCRSSGH